LACASLSSSTGIAADWDLVMEPYRNRGAPFRFTKILIDKQLLAWTALRGRHGKMQKKGPSHVCALPPGATGQVMAEEIHWIGSAIRPPRWLPTRAGGATRRASPGVATARARNARNEEHGFDGSSIQERQLPSKPSATTRASAIGVCCRDLWLRRPRNYCRNKSSGFLIDTSGT
jgi:hypothetical protein